MKFFEQNSWIGKTISSAKGAVEDLVYPSADVKVAARSTVAHNQLLNRARDMHDPAVNFTLASYFMSFFTEMAKTPTQFGLAISVLTTDTALNMVSEGMAVAMARRGSLSPQAHAEATAEKLLSGSTSTEEALEKDAPQEPQGLKMS
jgi:hypothetical protein